MPSLIQDNYSYNDNPKYGAVTLWRLDARLLSTSHYQNKMCVYGCQQQQQQKHDEECLLYLSLMIETQRCACCFHPFPVVSDSHEFTFKIVFIFFAILLIGSWLFFLRGSSERDHVFNSFFASTFFIGNNSNFCWICAAVLVVVKCINTHFATFFVGKKSRKKYLFKVKPQLPDEVYIFLKVMMIVLQFWSN